MKEVLKSILECPKHKKDDCPVVRKFRETVGELPVPEAYLGSKKAQFMIVGINPGMGYVRVGANQFKPVNLWSLKMRGVPYADFDLYVKTYMNKIRDYLIEPFLKYAWQYRRVCKIFNYSPENGEVMITNLVHCPSKRWHKDFTRDEQNTAFELCNELHPCRDIIKKVGPELVLLHGIDVVRFFCRLFDWNVEKKDIPIKKERNGIDYVLSRHLQSRAFPDWNALEKIAKTLEEKTLK